MQKNICSICLEPVELGTDILQLNDDIKCVHNSCLRQSQVGQRILAQMSYQTQSDEHETLSKTSFLRLSERPAIYQLSPFNQSSNPRCILTRCKKILYPVQKYSVDHQVCTTASKSISKTYSSSGSTKWFSSMRKNSYKIMPLFIRNKCLLRKEQPFELTQNKQGEETTIFPIKINDSDMYSSEILDWLATSKKNVPSSVLEKPMAQAVPSTQQKKKVTIQDTRDPYLTERRSRDYRKSLQRRASRRKREITTSSIASQYSNHSAKLNAADFMDWVTSAPKIPNGNMLILLDCRNKKDTKNIGVQPSFNDPQKNTARNTAESLILDLLAGRRRNDHYEYHANCQSQGSNVTLVKTCTTESRITTSLQENDDFHEASVKEQPIFMYPETVEEKMHHIVSIVFNALGHFSGLLGRCTKAMKDEFTYSDKNMNLDEESKVCKPNE